MKFYCVTPCFNAEKYIEETMLSVLTQSILEKPNVSLYYTVADGGSEDGTVAIAEKIKKRFSTKKNICINYFSEKDSGMYHALAKAFEKYINSEKHSVFSYINAGDYYSKNSFDIVYDIFNKNEVYFLTGINVTYNEKSHLTNFSLPFSYNLNLLKKGLYGKTLPFIQQESTFWKKELHDKIDFNKLSSLKYAGDYYLWKTFMEIFPLYIVSAWLGGFKIHRGQLSSIFIKEYYKEVEQFSLSPTIFDYAIAYIHKIIWHIPYNIKKKTEQATICL